MGINLVYERANQDAYDLLKIATNAMAPGDDLGVTITNSIFPTLLNKIGETITRSDLVDRNYGKFKIPLSEFGAITEYLASNMIKADNAVNMENGSPINDMVVNNPDIRASYATKLIRANYPITINSERWMDAVDGRNIEVLSQMIAISMQSLYDGIAHDHDSFIPALLGALYEGSPEKAKRSIPAYSGSDPEAYAKKVFAILNKSIRDMSQWRRSDFNMMGMEMSDSKEDLVLVAFDNSISDDGETTLDLITSQLTLGAMARAHALGEALGVEVYEMPSMGIIDNSVSRAYSLPNIPGMQTADMKEGDHTPKYPNVKFALVGKGALNVGLKRLQNDTGRSIRGHFDQTWVQPTLQIAYGAGQAIFFEIAEEKIGD